MQKQHFFRELVSGSLAAKCYAHNQLGTQFVCLPFGIGRKHLSAAGVNRIDTSSEAELKRGIFFMPRNQNSDLK